jgi:hypothetical protein
MIDSRAWTGRNEKVWFLIGGGYEAYWIIDAVRMERVKSFTEELLCLFGVVNKTVITHG